MSFNSVSLEKALHLLDKKGICGHARLDKELLVMGSLEIPVDADNRVCLRKLMEGVEHYNQQCRKLNYDNIKAVIDRHSLNHLVHHGHMTIYNDVKEPFAEAAMKEAHKSIITAWAGKGQHRILFIEEMAVDEMRNVFYTTYYNVLQGQGTYAVDPDLFPL